MDWMKFKIFLADRMMQFIGRGCEINMYIVHQLKLRF